MVNEMIGEVDYENVKSALYSLKENIDLLSPDTKKMSFKVEDIFKKNRNLCGRIRRLLISSCKTLKEKI